MTRGLLRAGAAGLALAATLTGVVACTSDEEPPGYVDQAVPLGSYRLVAFDSCATALAGLRAAYSTSLETLGYGYGGGGVAMDLGGAPAKGMAEGAPNALPQPATALGDGSRGGYSGTNTHEAGVDEPDLVKTDGRRIVTVTDGVLRVIDPALRRVVGKVSLSDTDSPYRAAATGLFLAGDHALVLAQSGYYGPMYAGGGKVVEGDPIAPDAGRPLVTPTPVDPKNLPIVGPQLILVDLVGTPRVLSTLRADGGLVDARQVGSVARVVLRSNPRISFPYLEGASAARQLETNQEIVAQAGIDAWLPRLEVTTGRDTRRADVDCGAISRPATYSGASLLTVLTYDLNADELDDGKPVSLVADGDTVYSNGPSLYVSSDQRWQVQTKRDAKPAESTTEIWRFDTSGPGRPRYAAGGSVKGYLINQYAMSEWGGNLRVATTTGEPWAPAGTRASSESGVHVLATEGSKLTEIGAVGGLGKGERIYAVRFVGPVGYVVTFRQTDPLYTVDLSDPESPRLRGALKIPGYSAYLHPAEGSRLIGLGQNATNDGRVTGTQVSLFDVADLDDPARVATYTVNGGNSQAEYDPHAFLYWPQTQLLVIPLQVFDAVPMPQRDPQTSDLKEPDATAGTGSGTSGAPAPAPDSKVKPRDTVGALLLRVNGTSFTKLGFISMPVSWEMGGYSPPIERSLMIDSTLWTVSRTGAMATNPTTLTRLAWIPFA